MLSGIKGFHCPLVVESIRQLSRPLSRARQGRKFEDLHRYRQRQAPRRQADLRGSFQEAGVMVDMRFTDLGTHFLHRRIWGCSTYERTLPHDSCCEQPPLLLARLHGIWQAL